MLEQLVQVSVHPEFVSVCEDDARSLQHWSVVEWIWRSVGKVALLSTRPRGLSEGLGPEFKQRTRRREDPRRFLLDAEVTWHVPKMVVALESICGARDPTQSRVAFASTCRDHCPDEQQWILTEDTIYRNAIARALWKRRNGLFRLGKWIWVIAVVR